MLVSRKGALPHRVRKWVGERMGSRTTTRFSSPSSRSVERYTTIALALACTLFMTEMVRERWALMGFNSHIDGIARVGGGVLLVMSPSDCTNTVEITDSLVADLQWRNVPVLGLIVRDGTDAAPVRSVLSAANDRFLHKTVSAREAVGFLGRIPTPVAIAVGPRGNVWVAERFHLEGKGGVPGLASRLLKAVEAEL